MHRFGGTTALLLVFSFVFFVAVPLILAQGSDTLVSIGSPTTPFSQNKRTSQRLPLMPTTRASLRRGRTIKSIWRLAMPATIPLAPSLTALASPAFTSPSIAV